jgi:hypothetical protein
MSTHIRDLSTTGFVQVKQSLIAAARTATANGTGIDFVNGDGFCFAMLHVGTTSGTAPTLDVKIQESTDNSTFTDISGATFTQATAAQSAGADVPRITFNRTKQYLRAVATIGGTTPSFICSVDIGEVNKYNY